MSVLSATKQETKETSVTSSTVTQEGQSKESDSQTSNNAGHSTDPHLIDVVVLG